MCEIPLVICAIKWENVEGGTKATQRKREQQQRTNYCLQACLEFTFSYRRQ